MREGWEMKKMAEVYDVRDGTHDSPKYQDKGYPLITSKNLKGGLITFDKIKYISEENYININKRSKVDIGDVLFAMIGTIGNPTLIINEPDYAIKNVALFKVDESQSSQYLKYYLESPYTIDKMLDDAKGSTQRFVGLGYLRKFPVPIPPLSEQKQIVAILDKAFTVIDQAKANIKKNIANTKELFHSKLNDIFSQKGDGWEEKTLKEISTDFGRGKSKNRPRNDKKLFGGKYPFVQTGDIRNTGKILKTFSQTYNEIGLAQSKLWPKGTICITIAANIAETAILDFDSCFPDSMIGLVVDTQKADSNYTYYALQFLKSRLQELGKGSAQDNINLGTFQKQYFPFPSIEKQKEIVVILDNISKQTIKAESKYQQKLFDLEDLKKSILQKAFAGALTQKEVAV